MEPIELEVDHETAMKNYIANENLGIATSIGYVKFSFTRSIHFGRVYTSGSSGTKGKEADLCEALRCLGQGLHCLVCTETYTIDKIAIFPYKSMNPRFDADPRHSASADLEIYRRTLALTRITQSLPCVKWVSGKFLPTLVLRRRSPCKDIVYFLWSLEPLGLWTSCIACK